MPVTTSKTISYVLARFNVDNELEQADIVLRQFIDGNAAGEVEFQITGAQFTAMRDVVPNGGLSRGHDIADAVYQFALANNFIDGTIT